MAETEKGFLLAARRGDEVAFLTLYHRHRTPLFRFAWRLTGSITAAADVTQECFLAVLQGAQFDPRRAPLRTYLFGVIRHLAMKHVRLSEKEDTEDVLSYAAPLDGALESLLSRERSEIVADAIAGLPPLQREALILFEYEDQSLEQIAAITGAEAGAVKARLHRARESLRKRLAPLLGGGAQGAQRV
jgi:RNA polymerase sigma-70 factor, ECF subfamily